MWSGLIAGHRRAPGAIRRGAAEGTEERAETAIDGPAAPTVAQVNRSEISIRFGIRPSILRTPECHCPGSNRDRPIIHPGSKAIRYRRIPGKILQCEL